MKLSVSSILHFHVVSLVEIYYCTQCYGEGERVHVFYFLNESKKRVVFDK